jgi:hypothetical protein
VVDSTLFACMAWNLEYQLRNPDPRSCFRMPTAQELYADTLALVDEIERELGGAHEN